jgi:hypothetical protein
VYAAWQLSLCLQLLRLLHRLLLLLRLLVQSLLLLVLLRFSSTACC